MQTLLSNFQAALDSDYGGIFAYCLRIESPAGSVWRFTSSDIAMVIGDERYEPGVTISPMAAQSTEGFNATSTGIEGIIDAIGGNGFSESSLRSGILNGAIARLFLVNLFDPPASLSETPAKFIEFPATKIKSINRTDTRWQAELSDSSIGLERKIGIETSKYCRAFFGDSDCQKNLAPLTSNLIAQAGCTKKELNHNQSFAINYFQYGKVVFTSGQNTGVARGIAISNGTTISLTEELPFIPAVNDTFQAIKGCAHTKIACIAYENIRNFRGESAIPSTSGYAGGR
jgi:uncharacterized phage protein (TIGR02218 family)